MCLCEDVLKGKCRSEPNVNPVRADRDHGTNLEQSLPDRADSRMSQFGALQAQSAQSLEEQQSKSAESQPQLITRHPMGTGAIGVQIQILLLDLVFHVAARTVKVFITLLRAEAIRGLLVLVKTFGSQVGDNKTRIVFVP